ncbi:MAG: sigma-70 family RNA polymerase sigma factor [Oscillospiraceae bacterium]|jgi:RNA polymerase sigma factor (sigma-70 family)|nr:sigma-70 family RNA polymerase sigma factor [Oscillospiraceae bacterium]
MDKRYIWLDGTEIEVSEDVYNEYMRATWREENRRRACEKHECSYDFLCEHDLDEQTVRGQALVDDIVVDKILLEELYSALSELTVDESNLINALFFGEQSEIDYAEVLNISQQSVNKRKKKILEKLRKKIFKK